MNIEKITEAKSAISSLLAQIDSMIHAKNHIEVAISHFDAVHAGGDIVWHERHSLRVMTDELKMQIGNANRRINNFKRVIDEEVNA